MRKYVVIGDTVTIEGIKYKCLLSESAGCKHCDLNGKCSGVYCTRNSRLDHKDVIFKVADSEVPLGTSNHELIMELKNDTRIGVLVRTPNGALHHIIAVEKAEPFGVVGERFILDLDEEEI